MITDEIIKAEVKNLTRDERKVSMVMFIAACVMTTFFIGTLAVFQGKVPSGAAFADILCTVFFWAMAILRDISLEGKVTRETIRLYSLKMTEELRQ